MDISALCSPGIARSIYNPRLDTVSFRLVGVQR
jgi:hypothetical protein